jgi:hypothetical protein
MFILKIVLLVLFLAMVVFGLAFWQFTQHKNQIQRLARLGVETTGVITKKSSRPLGHITQRYLHYTFAGPDGKTYRQSMQVSPYIWRCYDAGTPIEVVYLAKSPMINTPAYLVGEIRKMMMVET